jgi:hypothetical protein
MKTLPLETKVIRIGSAADSNTGRTGHIVEINEQTGRYRVMWTAERNGREMKLRTWVQFKFVMEIK